MMPRSSTKSLLLILAPVIFLALLGLFLRFRTASLGPSLAKTGPLEVVVTDVRFQELDAREVSAGFDTKVVVTLNAQGQFPRVGKNFYLESSVENVRLVLAGNQPRNIPLKEYEDYLVQRQPGPNNSSSILQSLPGETIKSERFTFLLSLASIPPSSTPLDLSAQITGSLQGQITRGTITSFAQLAKPKPTTFNFTVRQPNQIAEVPQVSHESKISIGNAKVQLVSPVDSESIWTIRRPTVRVLVPVKWPEEETQWASNGPQLDFGDPYIEDDHNKRYYEFGESSKSRHGSPIMARVASSIITGDDSTKNQKYASFTFPADSISPSAGKLTLKTRISADDLWSVPVSVTVRDANQHPPSQHSPIHIVKTQVRTIRQGDMDRQVDIWLKPTLSAATLKSKKLISNWSQHLVDSKGWEFWDLAKPVPGQPGTLTGIPIKHAAIFDNKTGLYKVTYKLPTALAFGAKGKLSFLAEVGFEGYKLLPVKVVLP